MNNAIKFPTMDAINFSRMIAYNAMDMNVGMWQIKIVVDKLKICDIIRLKNKGEKYDNQFYKRYA